MLRTFLAISGMMLAASSARAELKVSDIQAIYAGSGFIRKTLDYQPKYDQIYFRFRAEGVQVDLKGYLNLRVVSTLSDASGKVLLTETSSPPFSWIGTASKDPICVALFASVNLDGQLQPGQYWVTVTINDRLASKKVTFKRQIKIDSLQFSILEPGLFENNPEHDPNRQLLRESPLAGEPLYFSAYVRELGCTQEKCDFLVKYLILDTHGKELSLFHGEKEFRGIQRFGRYEAAEPLYITWPTGIPEPGDYTIRLQATDRIANKTTTLDLPFYVRAR